MSSRPPHPAPSPTASVAGPGHAAVYGKLVLVALIWGGTFIAGRIVSLEVAPASAALWRYVVASVAVVVAHGVLEGRLPRLTARQWLGVSLLGATGVAAYNLCFMIGLQTVPASRASLIVALNPAMTFVGAILLFGERPTPMRIAGVALALCGVAVVIGHGNPAALLSGGISTGDAIVFGCVLSWSSYTLIGKRILVGLSPLAATTYASLIGTVLLALVAAWLPAPHERRHRAARGVGHRLARARLPRRVRHRGRVRLVLRRRARAGPGARRRCSSTWCRSRRCCWASRCWTSASSGRCWPAGSRSSPACGSSTAPGRRRRCLANHRWKKPDAADRRTVLDPRHDARVRAGAARAAGGALGPRASLSARGTRGAGRARRAGHGRTRRPGAAPGWTTCRSPSRWRRSPPATAPRRRSSASRTRSSAARSTPSAATRRRSAT